MDLKELKIKLDECKTENDIENLFLEVVKIYRDKRSEELVKPELDFFVLFLNRNRDIDYLDLLYKNYLTVRQSDCENLAIFYVRNYICKDLEIVYNSDLYDRIDLFFKDRNMMSGRPPLYKNKIQITTSYYIRIKNLYQIFLQNYYSENKIDPYEIIKILQKFIIVKDRKNGFKDIFNLLFFKREDELTYDRYINPNILKRFNDHDDYLKYIIKPYLHLCLIQKDKINEKLLNNFCEFKGERRAPVIENGLLHEYQETETIIRSLRDLFGDEKIDKIMKNIAIKKLFR